MSVIEKNYELEAYFQNAGKPRDKWRVGTEYEKVGIYRDTGQAIPYFGKRGVDFYFAGADRAVRLGAEEQDGNIIALSRDKAQITLEPGGQIELSGEPCDSIHCTYAEFNQHIRELLEVAEPSASFFSASACSRSAGSTRSSGCRRNATGSWGRTCARSARSASA